MINKKLYTDERIKLFAYDAENYSNAIDYCNLYLDILNYNRAYRIEAALVNILFPRFFIKKLKAAINDNIPEKERKILIKYYNLDKKGIKHYLRQDNPKDIAIANMKKSVLVAIEYLKSFKSLYIYHEFMHMVMDGIASKIKDSEKYSVVECTKYAHIYYRYIKDYQFMPHDEHRMFNKKEIEEQNSEYPFQDVAVVWVEWNDFFLNIPDGDIIIPMIKKFIWETDQEIDDIISSDGQLKEDKFYRISCAKIRKVKEHIFKNGEWNYGDYCRVSKIKESLDKLDILKKAYKEYSKKYEWNAERKEKVEVLIPCQGVKEIEIPCFAEFNFKDEIEMLQFGHLINYMKQNKL